MYGCDDDGTWDYHSDDDGTWDYHSDNDDDYDDDYDDDDECDDIGIYLLMTNTVSSPALQLQVKISWLTALQTWNSQLYICWWW